MSVYIPKGAKEYWYEFQRGGGRFRGATGKTSRRDALEVEKAKKREVETSLERRADARFSLAINYVMERYWEAVGKDHAGRDNTFRDLSRLQDYFNAQQITELNDITDDDVAALIAWRRRKPLANGTVNRSTIEVLRKLFAFAKKRERARFDHEPIWSDHLLPEKSEHPRELQPGEFERLTTALREDYGPLIAFARATGLRQREIYDLRWSEVLWDVSQIRRKGKGDRLITRPITTEVRKILWPLRGHHPEFVFTYVAERTQNLPTGKRGSGERSERVAGQRYPIGKGGLWSRWRRDRAKSGVTDFRFHDFRHDLATKALRETHDLKLVQKMLGHSDLRTTARYAHVTEDDVTAAFERLHAAKQKSPKKSPKILGEKR